MASSAVGAPLAIGPYHVTGVLGEGGMGVVYAAEQREPIQRRVAVKVIRGGGFDYAEVARRLEVERQALALMEHPGIASVIDAGATDEGLPFFAMEYVDGVPFTTWCDRHRLSTRERVRLFIPLCHAIQHAHQKGVIHRDLKPSNVLVTAQAGAPMAKVIDFGIAKAVDRRLSAETLVTMAGLAMGTPAYMSPEQAEGNHLDVDTRTDVYALGVMLYEVLAGSLPMDPAKVGLAAFVARLMSRLTLPPTPSARIAEAPPETSAAIAAQRATEPAALAREVRGDLDAIALKALAPERERRYQTAQELAEDLERYLHHEPVRARAPSVGYRAGKFVRRHPTAVTLAASAFVFLVGLTTVATVQAERVARAREVADRRRTQAEELLGFMTGELRAKLAPLGKLSLFDDVDRRALAYFASVTPNELSGAELLARSQSLSGIGQVRMAQGDLDLAMQAFRASLGQLRDLAARDTGNVEWQAALGAGHFWVGNVHFLRSRLDSAAAEFGRYLDVSRRLAARDSTKPEWQLELGYAHSNIGSVREAQGDFAGAIQAFRYTLDVKRRLVALDPDNLEWQVDLGVSHNTLGRAHERAGRLDSAEAHYRADLAVREAVARRDPANAVWQERLVPALAYLGGLELLRGRLPDARVHADSALRVSRALAQRDPENADKARESAGTAYQLARIELADGRVAQALSLAESGRRLLSALAARDTSNQHYRVQLAASEIEVARALARRGDVAAARAALAAAEARLAPLGDAPGAEARTRLELARARVLLGSLYEREGRAGLARDTHAAALRALGEDAARDELRASEVRARALEGRGRTADAAPLRRRLRDAGVRTHLVE